MFTEVRIVDGHYEVVVFLNKNRIRLVQPDYGVGGGTMTKIEMDNGSVYFTHADPADVLGKAVA